MLGDKESYKVRGELETKHGLDPLPPTYITPRAIESLKVVWGLSDLEIQYLRYFSSQFRYDLCPQKAERLASIPVEIFSIQSVYQVNLPSFNDIMGRLDGQCGDIAQQWLVQMSLSGLVKKLNKNNEKRIITAIYSGLSETHFCREGSNHFWNGLVLLDNRYNIQEELYVDASFQNIHLKAESFYDQRTGTYDITRVENSENSQIRLGWVEFSKGSWGGSCPMTTVLGVSSDYNLAYSLGFVRDVDTGVIKPLLNVIYPDGKNGCYIYGNSGQVMSSGEREEYELNKREILKILNELQRLTFVESPPTETKLFWDLD
jgi:hypothetical protein